jgi:hypothetical protein
MGGGVVEAVSVPQRNDFVMPSEVFGFSTITTPVKLFNSGVLAVAVITTCAALADSILYV